jgi:ribosome-binding protein aMBF1 (putative translation factor)
MSWFSRWFGPKKCALCGKKPQNPRKYFNDKGVPVLVCLKCSEYAERRAYRRR